ncbi:serine/threonine protein kinase, partial [bacterium]|nr:serine/threonine protein kinase [bacterium]
MKIGRYEVLKELGKGSFGLVFMAYDTQLDRNVAIKRLRDPVTNLEDIKFLTREARTAAKLIHTNIVQIHDIIIEDNYLYFVMEYIEGQSLDDWLEAHGPCKTEELGSRIGMFVDVLNAVRFMHEHSIVHRDLKAANIMLNELGQAKLLDFGLASIGTSSLTNKTFAGFGTPNYMAPEQLSKDKKVDSRADIYALGIIFYELLTGRLPYSSHELGALMEEILHQDPIPPSAFNSVIPSDIDQIIVKMLRKEPFDRPTIEEILEVLTGRNLLTSIAVRRVVVDEEEETPSAAAIWPTERCQKAYSG